MANASTNTRTNASANASAVDTMPAVRKRHKIRVSTGERVFDTLNILFMLVLIAITIYPFWYIIVMSLNEGNDAMAGPIWFWPRKFTLINYEYALNNPYLIQSFLVTVARAVLGALLSISVLLLAAYALSKRYLKFRKTYIFLFMIPLFIGGNVVTNYLVIAKFGLLNNFLVYILPGAFSFFFMIIIRTFIEQLPEGMEESAMIDGAGYLRVFYHIIIPLAKPILAAMAFFVMVSAWLDFSSNLFYITKKSLYVMQYWLYLVTLGQSNTDFMDAMKVGAAIQNAAQGVSAQPTPQVLKMSTLVIVTLPLLFIYPFFQRFFIKGMLVGAIKA
ncbi:carbohydrate ABC transporter permease [Paenibacillus montanisoli]|uniref:Carbohydrate ABC transporter permease n=1 Tax=Paenibacillus montanisoli TaxID=2081970 RepID=A0A328UAT6_9BACL|nr:carbohydrate ABC transporter permease [Paenibacillus montanisoli]RAP78431.1 carbohydrate ABC transporter permease [Paenibacillus montanisoli]